MATNIFECTVDEILGSNVALETMEVREPPRYEENFQKLQKTLNRFGFEVRTDMNAMTWALYKRADGTLTEEPPRYVFKSDIPGGGTQRWRRSKR